MPTLSNYIGTGNAPLVATASLGQLTVLSGNMTAAGTTQTTAVALQTDFNVFLNVAVGTGTILPANSAYINATDVLLCYNHGANALLMYPPVGGFISTLAVNTAVSIPAGKYGQFTNLGGNKWGYSISN